MGNYKQSLLLLFSSIFREDKQSDNLQSFGCLHDHLPSVLMLHRRPKTLLTYSHESSLKKEVYVFLSKKQNYCMNTELFK
jgi:hypothetical protein